MFEVWGLRHYFCSRTVPLILHFLSLRVVLVAKWQLKGGPVALLHDYK